MKIAHVALMLCVVIAGTANAEDKSSYKSEVNVEHRNDGSSENRT
jgi:hypothetical protein